MNIRIYSCARRKNVNYLNIFNLNHYYSFFYKTFMPKPIDFNKIELIVIRL